MERREASRQLVDPPLNPNDGVHLLTSDILLTTTRAVRKRLDLTRPVPSELLLQCIDVAIQAPCAALQQDWRFVFVQNPETKRAIAALYARARDEAHEERHNYRNRNGTDSVRLGRTRAAGDYLQQHLHEVPVLMFPCLARPAPPPDLRSQATWWGSILPATWSFMLAARDRGLGSTWTTVHLAYAREVAELLRLPDDVTQAGMIPVAYYTGESFKPAARLPAKEVVRWEEWT
jgi:nitroreductase